MNYFPAAVSEGSLGSDPPPVSTAPSANSWELPEISSRSIIPMASEEELEELQDMVDELLHSDSNEGQTGQGRVFVWKARLLSFHPVVLPLKATF